MKQMKQVNSASSLVSAFALFIFAGASGGPASADETVFTSHGFHRQIETFIDSQHRFAKDLENPTRQLTKAREAAKALKAKGGLPYARAASELGCILFDDENYNEAEPLFKQALEIRKSAPASSAPDRAAAIHNLGALYELRKSGGDPADCYFSAMKLVTEGKPTEFRAYEEQNLGEFLYNKKSLQMAEGMFRRSVKDHDALSTKPSREFASLLQSLAICMEGEGHATEAEPFGTRGDEMFNHLPKEKVPKGWTSGGGSGP